MTRRSWGLTHLLALTLLLLTACGFLLSGVSWACPMCKEALGDPAQAQAVTRVARGYAVSIAALIGMPFILVSGVAMLIVRANRRRHANLR